MIDAIREHPTLDKLLEGHSIARFGDGEIRLAIGRDVKHQKAIPKLSEELRHILKNPTKCLVGVPYICMNSPKYAVWKHYDTPVYKSLYNPEKQYYSAFITRPDSAPLIDKPTYWQNVKKLWLEKNIIVVSGSRKGFRDSDLLHEASSVKFIESVPTEAYAEIDNIEKEIGDDTSKVVLLSLGATATVLAWRLAEKGFQALDLGHLPMFMRRLGVLNNHE